MIEAEMNHCRIVRESLDGKRPLGEQTFASMAILEERLGRLRKLQGLFDNVRFSAAVRKLKKQRSAVTVG